MAGRWRRLLHGRVAVALALSLPALWIQNSPFRDTTFISSWSEGVLDQVLLWRRTVHAAAPAVVVVNFGGKDRLDYFRSQGLIAPDAPPEAELRLPQDTPLKVVQGVMETARRGGAKLVLIDVDVLPIDSFRASRLAAGAPSGGSGEASQAEFNSFEAFLKGWSEDPQAPLAALVRIPIPVITDGAFHLSKTPWDGVVEAAPNLIWAQSFTPSDGDTVLRQGYYECLNGALQRATPSLALVAMAGAKAATSLAAKTALQQAMTGATLCANPATDLSQAAGPGFSLAMGRDFKFPHQNGLINYHLSAEPQWTNWSRIKGGPHDNFNAFKVLPLKALLAGAPEEIRGAVVVLGSSLPTAPDRHVTPFGVMDGDVVVANAARGLIAFGPVRETPIWFQLCLLTAILLLVDEFYDAANRLNRLARRSRGRIWWPLLRAGTAGPMAKIYALGLVYVTTVVIGWIMLDNAYWQAVPFIAASIYILIGDAVDIIEGRNLRTAEGE